MDRKPASPYVHTFPGDQQGVDRNLRVLIEKTKVLEARVKASENAAPVAAPTEPSSPAFTLPLETLPDGSGGLRIVLDDGATVQPLEVDPNTGGLYQRQGTAQADSVAAVLATLVADFNTLLASLRAAGHLKT